MGGKGGLNAVMAGEKLAISPDFLSISLLVSALVCLSVCLFVSICFSLIVSVSSDCLSA